MIITQPKELIAAFVNVRQGFPPETSWGNYNALGLVRGGHLVAGVIYNGYEGANVNIHVGAVQGSRWMTKEFLYATFDYPFNQLGRKRLSAYIRATNKRTIAFVKKLGFVYEGKLQDFYTDGGDMVIYGLLRSKCRFLEMRKAA